ncbi:unnamed protein product [Bursaphelenchus xylophilus]|uniref:(pine wood nematode) hypothetical protein n=1 Tax=Bursaphelenchus xylophilus TaxID=6326 RepID=A0A1I7SKY4_BURXY|nr:unnamed protein product [Bursaphelenchus xylophilus]CAG9129299.1 unnamed protein product [Bursaphelenchus xylophilus]
MAKPAVAKENTRKTPMKTDDVKTTWDYLKTILQKIAHNDTADLSFDLIYTNVASMVENNAGNVVYNGSADVLKELLGEMRQSVEATLEDPNFIEQLKRTYQDFRKTAGIMKDVLMYLNRGFIQKNRLPNISDMAMNLYRQEIIDHPAVKAKIDAILRNGLNNSLANDDRQAYKDTVDMLSGLGIDGKRYKEELERKIVDDLTLIYQRKALELLDLGSTLEYVKRAREYIGRETQIVQEGYEKGTAEKIIQSLKYELISKQKEMILKIHNGMENMLVNVKIDDLREVYELFSKVDDGVDALAAECSRYLRIRGEDLFQQFSGIGGPEYLEEIIQLKEVFDRFLSESFDNSDTLRTQIQADFDYFLTLEQNISQANDDNAVLHNNEPDYGEESDA